MKIREGVYNKLVARDTLSVGQADDLKLEDQHYRVWVSRVVDGDVSVEVRSGGRWVAGDKFHLTGALRRAGLIGDVPTSAVVTSGDGPTEEEVEVLEYAVGIAVQELHHAIAYAERRLDDEHADRQITVERLIDRMRQTLSRVRLVIGN